MNNIKNYLIDYELLGEAQKYYDRKGFHPIEVPWVVDKEFSLITTTKDKTFATKPSKHVVGSAEQAFLQLAVNKKLVEHYRYQAITPCFRRDTVDESHSQWFMKLELFEFCTDATTNPKLNLGLEYTYLISSAFEFFQTTTGKAFGFFPHLAPKTEIVATEDGSDITVNGVEVGSYGKRCYKNVTWIYGTGVALPRLKYAENHDPSTNSMVTIA